MARAPEVTTVDPQVTVRGDVGDRQVEAAVEKLRAACRTAPRPVLSARLALTMEADPALERPAVVKAGVDVSGRIVRAHVACPTMDEAVDRATDRIRRGIHDLAERRRAARRRTGVHELGEWRHGDLPAARPGHFPRPVEERELVRTKSPSIGRLTPEEAAFEMAILDHDFHLFTDAATGADCLIHRTDDGDHALVSRDPQAGRGPAGEPAELTVRHPPTMTLADALSQLDQSAAPFVAFVDADRARLHVAYRRYDGHYGLVAPAEEA